MPKFLDHTIMDVTFESIVNQTVQRSLNFKTVVSAHNAQYWKFFITLQLSNHVTPENAVATFAQVSALEYDTFDFPIPQGRWMETQTTFSGRTKGRQDRLRNRSGSYPRRKIHFFFQS